MPTKRLGHEEAAGISFSEFVIRTFIRHSSFVLRHLASLTRLRTPLNKKLLAVS